MISLAAFATLASSSAKPLARPTLDDDIPVVLQEDLSIKAPSITIFVSWRVDVAVCTFVLNLLRDSGDLWAGDLEVLLSVIADKDGSLLVAGDLHAVARAGSEVRCVGVAKDAAEVAVDVVQMRDYAGDPFRGGPLANAARVADLMQFKLESRNDAFIRILRHNLQRYYR